MKQKSMSYYLILSRENWLNITVLIFTFMGILSFIKFVLNSLFAETPTIVQYVDIIMAYIGYLIILILIIFLIEQFIIFVKYRI